MTEPLKLKPLSASLLSLVAGAVVDVLRTIKQIKDSEVTDDEAVVGLAICAHADRLALVIDALYVLPPAVRSADLPLGELVARVREAITLAVQTYGSDLATLQQIGGLADSFKDLKAA